MAGITSLEGSYIRPYYLLSLFMFIVVGCDETSSSTTLPHAKQPAPEAQTAKEYEMSFEAMRTAAENGDARAQAALGYAYDIGEGVTQNLETAAYWYRQAAEQGYANAQFNLAEMIRDGAGVAQSNEAALEWYTKAAMQGHSKAQYNVAMMHVQGKGVAANNVTAYAWLVLSATGDAESADQARDIVGEGIGDKIAEGNALAESLKAQIRANAK